MPNEPRHEETSLLIEVLDAYRELSGSAPNEGALTRWLDDLSDAGPGVFALDASVRRLFDSAPNPIIVCHWDGRVAHITPRAHQAFFPATGSQEPSLPDRMRPAWAARLERAFAQTVADSRSYFGQFPVLCSDGVKRRFDMTITNLLNNPLVNGVVVALQLTRVIQKSDRAAKDSQKHFEAVYNFSSYAVAITRETDAILLDANRGFEKLTGYTRREAVGRSLTRMGLGATPELRRVMSHLHTVGPLRDWQTPYVTKNGKRITLLISANRVRLNGVDCVISFSRDVTARSEALTELRDNTQRLREEQAELREKNVTLKQILEHVGRDRADFRTTINRRIREALDPLLEELSGSGDKEEQKMASLLSLRLREVVTADWKAYSENVATLTPRQHDVCNLIREGYSSQQIAEELNVSLQTVHKHRQVIRQKLQLSNQAVNLASYLRSQ